MAQESKGTSGETLPPCKCAVCGYEFDSATCTDSDARPIPGDFTLCLKCGEIMVFDPTLATREPSLEELNVLQQDSGAWRQIERAQRLMRHIRPLSQKP